MHEESPFSRLLVAVDLSACSRHALEFAVDFASLFGAVVDVLYVWQTSTERPVTAAREEAKRSLADFVGDLAPASGGLHRLTEYGDPYMTGSSVAQLGAFTAALEARATRADYQLFVCAVRGGASDRRSTRRRATESSSVSAARCSCSVAGLDVEAGASRVSVPGQATLRRISTHWRDKLVKNELSSSAGSSVSDRAWRFSFRRASRLMACCRHG